jgi:hypothetical protein
MPAEKVGSRSKRKLLNIILENPAVKEVLENAGELNLPNWFVGAGCIAQTVWNKYHGYDLTKNITDIDLVYFDDNDLSYEAEDEIINLAKSKFSRIPISIDVKNQARVHIWYSKHFGYDIPPYSSIEDALRSWPTTATSIGIRKENEDYIVFAPFGLDDLLGLIVRANKAQITEEIYNSKVKRWTKCWPDLKVIPW